MILAFSASHANVMNINGGIACLDGRRKAFRSKMRRSIKQFARFTK